MAITAEIRYRPPAMRRRLPRCYRRLRHAADGLLLALRADMLICTRRDIRFPAAFSRLRFFIDAITASSHAYEMFDTCRPYKKMISCLPRHCTAASSLPALVTLFHSQRLATQPRIYVPTVSMHMSYHLYETAFHFCSAISRFRRK